MKLNVLNRKLHYWASAAVMLPLLAVIVTGLLLQVKKQVTWVQPPEQRGSLKNAPALHLNDVLSAVRTQPQFGAHGWEHIDRLDVRPDKGIVKVRLRDNHEVQVDLGTGEVLQVAYRRSDLIESIHDGSIFGDWVKLGVILPTGAVLLFLWASGVWMWVYPLWNRRRVRRGNLRGPKGPRLRMPSGLRS
jgi:uncharacterized iron-regulated membrane protein